MNTEYTGKRISSLRKEKGLTQKELAENLHITDKAVSKWERGLNYPDLSLFPKLALILDCSVTELLGVSEDIPVDTFNLMINMSNYEKKIIQNKVRDFFMLTIGLCIVICIDKFYLVSNGYIWETYNFQFWIEGIIFGLSATLITNGLYWLRKHKK